MHQYDPKLNGIESCCEVCGDCPSHIDSETGKRLGSVIQHHISGRRYSDQCIWVCNICHAKIHNPTAFGLPASWAYDNNYLLRRGNFMIKTKKTKTCSHSVTYYNYRLDHIVCTFCGKKVEELKFGTRKNAGTKANSKTDKAKTVKMGFDDKQPAHVIEAAKLKNKLDSLKVRINRVADPLEKEAIGLQMAKTIERMQELQKEHDME